MGKKSYRQYDLPLARTFHEENHPPLSFSLEKLAEYLRVDVQVVLRIKNLGLLSFNMEWVGVDAITLDRYQLDELGFLSTVARLDISDELLVEMFRDLDRPYFYDKHIVSFDFSRMRWVCSGHGEGLRDLLCDAVEYEDYDNLEVIYCKVMEAVNELGCIDISRHTTETLKLFAENICNELKLKTIDCMKSLSGKKLFSRFGLDIEDYDDYHGIDDAWEQFCVTEIGAEHDDIYKGAILDCVSNLVSGLKEHEIFTVWMQTSYGEEWMNNGLPIDEPCIDKSDIAEHIIHDYVLPAAETWSRENLWRKFSQ